MVKISAFDLIKDLTPISTLRLIAQTKDDELLRSLFAFIVCETAGGLSEIPTKTHKTELAKICLKKGIDKNKIIDVLKISRATIKRLKHDAN